MQRVEELSHQDRMTFHIYLCNQNGDPFGENIHPYYNHVWLVRISVLTRNLVVVTEEPDPSYQYLYDPPVVTLEHMYIDPDPWQPAANLRADTADPISMDSQLNV